jgi:hypothetical protein
MQISSSCCHFLTSVFLFRKEVYKQMQRMSCVHIEKWNLTRLFEKNGKI